MDGSDDLYLVTREVLMDVGLVRWSALDHMLTIVIQTAGSDKVVQ